MSRWQRLSGYLHTKPTGPFKRLKGSQRQWYEFDEASMTIRVFRTEEEANTLHKEPLRVINVLNAVFNIDLTEMNQFIITSDEKEHVLQAETEEAMHLWLHTLKSKRNETINNDPATLLPFYSTPSVERKRSARISLSKMQTNLMKSTPAVTYDVAEFQCSPPVNTFVHWRPGRTISNTSSSSASQGRQSMPTTPPKTSSDAQEALVPSAQTSQAEAKSSADKVSCNNPESSKDVLDVENINALKFHHIVDEDEDDVDVDNTNSQTLLVTTTQPLPENLKNIWNISSNGRTQSVSQRTQRNISGECHPNSVAEKSGEEHMENESPVSNKNHSPDSEKDVSISEKPQDARCDDRALTISASGAPLKKNNSSDFQHDSELHPLDGKLPAQLDLGGFITVQDMGAFFDRLDSSQITPNAIRVLRDELEDYHQRVYWLQKTLSIREAALAELDQRIAMLDNIEDRPSSLVIPPGTTNSTLRKMLVEMEKKQRILQARMRFLVGEIRDLGAVRQMLTDHGAKQARYTKKLTTEVFEWKQEYVKLLECCLGAFHLDASHGLMFSDYGKERCKEKLSALLEESRRKDPSLPSLYKPNIDDCHVDSYGFKQPYSSETALMHYACKNLHIFLSRQRAGEEQLVQHWNEILRQPQMDTLRSELKELCRAGIPAAYRSGIWRMLIRGELKSTITKKGPHYYNRLIAEISESKVATKYRKQISLDLLRTMPNNVNFESLESPGIQKLQEVLQAYSIHNPDIGYCQGMNFLVAVALLVLQKEDAFWCLTAILEKYLPSKYFNCGLISAQVDQLVLKDLLANKLPKLAEHINKMEIDISAITLNWFLVLFYDCVPFETLIRIWDIFLLEGRKSLFRFALALLKRSEELLLLQTDTISFWKCLKSVARLTYDAESLIKTAYEGLKPFVSRSTISSLRNQHYEILNKEMNEKKRVWQTVQKEVAEETLDEQPEEVTQPRRSRTDRPCIHAATSYNGRFVWICHGDKFGSHISEVHIAQNHMIELNLSLNTRVTCIEALHENILLIGTMSGKLCAYSMKSKKKLWHIPLQDTVTDIATVNWPQEAMNKVFAGLSNGELVVIEDADHNEPKDSFFKFTIGFTRITSLLVVDNLLLCGCGNSVYTFNTATLDYHGQFSISSNALDLILTMKDSKYGVWIAVRGSPLIELWDIKTRSRLMLFDTHSENYANGREDEEGTFDVHRVTALLPHENTVWVGTGNGDIVAFEVYDTPGYEKRLRTFAFPDSSEEQSIHSKADHHVSTRDASVATDVDELTNQANKLSEDPVGADKNVEMDSKKSVDRILPTKLEEPERLPVQNLYTEVPGIRRIRSEACYHDIHRVTSSTFETESQKVKESHGLHQLSNLHSPLRTTSLRIIDLSDNGPCTQGLKSGDMFRDCLRSTNPNSSPVSNKSASVCANRAGLSDSCQSLLLNHLLPTNHPPAHSPAHSVHSSISIPSASTRLQNSSSEINLAPVPLDYKPMFLPLRRDVRLVGTCADETLRFQLHPIIRNKVSETPIRLFATSRSQSGEPHIVSCATFFYDDDAVLNWYRCPTQPMVWTNQPILVFDANSQQVHFPTYMINSLRMRKERSRWSIVPP